MSLPNSTAPVASAGQPVQQEEQDPLDDESWLQWNAFLDEDLNYRLNVDLLKK